jgi:hypothetical protein
MGHILKAWVHLVKLQGHEAKRAKIRYILIDDFIKGDTIDAVRA